MPGSSSSGGGAAVRFSTTTSPRARHRGLSSYYARGVFIPLRRVLRVLPTPPARARSSTTTTYYASTTTLPYYRFRRPGGSSPCCADGSGERSRRPPPFFVLFSRSARIVIGSCRGSLSCGGGHRRERGSSSLRRGPTDKDVVLVIDGSKECARDSVPSGPHCFSSLTAVAGWVGAAAAAGLGGAAAAAAGGAQAAAELAHAPLEARTAPASAVFLPSCPGTGPARPGC